MFWHAIYWSTSWQHEGSRETDTWTFEISKEEPRHAQSQGLSTSGFLKGSLFWSEDQSQRTKRWGWRKINSPEIVSDNVVDQRYLLQVLWGPGVKDYVGTSWMWMHNILWQLQKQERAMRMMICLPQRQAELKLIHLLDRESCDCTFSYRYVVVWWKSWGGSRTKVSRVKGLKMEVTRLGTGANGGGLEQNCNYSSNENNNNNNNLPVSLSLCRLRQTPVISFSIADAPFPRIRVFRSHRRDGRDDSAQGWWVGERMKWLSGDGDTECCRPGFICREPNGWLRTSAA